MKKFFLILFSVLISALFLTSCGKVPPYMKALSEVKYNLYEGSNDKVTVTAHAGFREFPMENDMKTGTVKYYITFKLVPADGNMDKVYSVTFSQSGENYGDTFSEDEVTHNLVCTVAYDNKTPFSSLDLTIKTTDWATNLTVTSVLPENTADYKTALKAGAEILKDVFAEHTDGNTLLGEIRMRIIVKDGKSYWYIGYHYSNSDCISMLLDGETLELLARRTQN